MPKPAADDSYVYACVAGLLGLSVAIVEFTNEGKVPFEFICWIGMALFTSLFWGCRTFTRRRKMK